MATTPRKKSTTTAIATWDEELAKYAQAYEAQEASVAAGQFFSLRAGQLSFNDTPLDHNQMAAIIIDAVMENAYYTEAYDSDNPTPPTCFAFGRDPGEIAPHPDVVALGQQMHEQCQGCPMNEFGTADRGRGKACRNSRRLALIPAGTFDRSGQFTAYDDPHHFVSTPLAFLKLPPTSVKGYAAYVKSLAAGLRKPPFVMFTLIKVAPDPTTQFKVIFEALAPAPDELIPTLIQRHEEAQAVIEFPYDLTSTPAPTPAPKGGRRSPAKAPVKPSAGRGANAVGARKKY